MDSATAALINSLQSRLRLLEDKDALHTLINTYTAACDAGDATLFSTTFTRDSTMAAAWFGEIRGRDTIAQGIASGKDWGHLMHRVSNVQVQVSPSEPNRATGRAYLSFYAVKDAKQPGRNYVFGGPYTFTFVREGEEDEDGGKRGWRIARLEIERWWEQGVDETGAFQGSFTKD